MKITRRTFIASGASAVAAFTSGHGRLFAQTHSVPNGRRRFSADNISCLVQPDSIIFLRDNHPMITYKTTFADDSPTPSSKKAAFSVPFPCFTRLTAPTSLLPLSPLNASAAAAFVCNNVSGVNYTSNFSKISGKPCGQIRSHGLKWIGMSEIGSDGILPKMTNWQLGIQAIFEDACDWVDPNGQIQMTDMRRFRIAFYERQKYGIYATIDWYAVNDVHITANNQCLFGVQASAPLCPAGGGTMMNSNGTFGSPAVYGRRANWMTCWGSLTEAARKSGRRLVNIPNSAPAQEGVALMSHPSNPWGVSPWNTTEFGYMSPTNIPFLVKPWTLRAGEGIRLRYLTLAYTGNPNGGTVDEIYRNYIQT